MDATGGIRFIADAMLGRLAKWLRVLGYDTEYVSQITDRELLQRAATTGRTILTRDIQLAQRRVRGYGVWLVQGDDFRDQLRQTVNHFRLDRSAGLFTRCLICNQPLQKISKPDSGVPAYVLDTQERFTQCLQCRRIYWPATHPSAMVRQLEDIFNP